MKSYRNVVKRRKFELIGGVLGIVAGYLYWKYVGCISGTCPIQANWYTMVPYGLLFGVLIGSMFKPKELKSRDLACKIPTLFIFHPR